MNGQRKPIMVDRTKLFACVALTTRTCITLYPEGLWNAIFKTTIDTILNIATRNSFSPPPEKSPIGHIFQWVNRVIGLAKYIHLFKDCHVNFYTFGEYKRRNQSTVLWSLSCLSVDNENLFVFDFSLFRRQNCLTLMTVSKFLGVDRLGKRRWQIFIK